jgi:hypothetical protein
LKYQLDRFLCYAQDALLKSSARMERLPGGELVFPQTGPSRIIPVGAKQANSLQGAICRSLNLICIEPVRLNLKGSQRYSAIPSSVVESDFAGHHLRWSWIYNSPPSEWELFFASSVAWQHALPKRQLTFSLIYTLVCS